MQTVTAAATEVEIKGAAYSVEPIAPGECGVSAVRVVKLVNGESYDLVRKADGLVECSCPNFVCRHEGKGTVCKHGAAMVARGFLPVDAPRPAPAVPPVTAADLKRASYFGLKLPQVDPAPAEVAAEPRPTRIERFAPTPEMEMERLGLELGVAGEHADAPVGRSFPELVAFYNGWLAGKAEHEAEYDAWLDSIEDDRERMDDAFGGPEASWHEAELAEARWGSGHPAYEG